MFVLASNYSNGWEAVFVGALQGGFIFLCILVYRYFRNKRNAKKEQEVTAKEKALSFIEVRETPHTNAEPDASLGDSKFSKSYLQAVFVELKEKCNPQCYMNPYSHEKVRVANEIYSALVAMADPNEQELITLRHRAIVELGIVFDTKSIYEYLASACNPTNFMDPYDAERVALANDLYAQIINNKNDIEYLESLRDKILKLGLITPMNSSKFHEGQLVVILSNLSQFNISSVDKRNGTFLYYSEKYNRSFSEDEIADYDEYWRNERVVKSETKKSASPLKRTSSENDLINKPKEANTLDDLTESLSNENSTQVLAQKGNSEQQEGCQGETMSVGPINPENTSSKYKLGQLVIVLSNEKQFKIDSIQQINGVYWYYSEEFKRLYSESEIADSAQYWNSHK